MTDQEQKLARDLELEYGCEQCHHAPATEMFDGRFVCSPCRRALEARLMTNG